MHSRSRSTVTMHRTAAPASPHYAGTAAPLAAPSDGTLSNTLPESTTRKRDTPNWDSMNALFSAEDGVEQPVFRESDGMHYNRHSGIKRIVKTKLPDDSEEYEKRAKGGPLMTAVTPIKLKPGQPYMFVDLNVPIRAIYFPLAQKPSTVFPDLCSYLMVDFSPCLVVRCRDGCSQSEWA